MVTERLDFPGLQAVGAVGGLSTARSSVGHAPPSPADVERIAGIADDALRLADLGLAAGLNGQRLMRLFPCHPWLLLLLALLAWQFSTEHHVLVILADDGIVLQQLILNSQCDGRSGFPLTSIAMNG